MTLTVQEQRERAKISRKKWRDSNPQKVLEARLRNAHKSSEYSKTYYETHKETRIRYINAHRKDRVRQATPCWANKAEIRKFYSGCPVGFHVDHIIPLHGKTVSGLHVLENLQYLPAQTNLSKGASFALHD